MGRRYARDWRGRFATTGSSRGRGSSSSVRRSSRRTPPKVTVHQLKGGRKTKLSKRRSAATVLQTRGTWNTITGNRAPRMLRPGSPIKGNKNRRYVSRTQTILSGGAKVASANLFNVSPAGRAHSAIVNRRSGGKLPKSGYVVEYSK